ncbi:hypothetical protein FHZ48_21015 [Salmonella enterica]|uniref:Uncharacterized protein n=2 Tax=Salmonella enterica TaxID=28901 RepID=A0A623I9S1_SALER|nr:hypothetical protein [Salmonella enterica]EBF8498033.1 hypothetical protein [Salmonella enterica subsp. enterica serovar Bovismorbificans]ECF4530427.1 hypothetical protein [Salmonella enterica subsp. enterica serovar Takoradi]EDQ6550137.1 hypothetical protein [Salmonella enterica subsp. enterica]EGZ3844639.1 hypothetical protein [Salmonella enterica subsp. enterica serovar Lexington]EGZ3852557.1 hypothetical protein [Salmonella enterica subsp. enterica serovar Barranquilla]
MKMPVRGLPYLRSLSFALIIIISLYTICCHYSLFAGVLLSFRKIVILCCTGCMTKEWGLCQRKPEAGSGLLPVVAVPSGAIFTVKPWPVLLDHYILRSYLGN